MLGFLSSIGATILDSTKPTQLQEGGELSTSSDIHGAVLLEIKIPKGNEKDALAAEQMFAALHGLLRLDFIEQEHLSFEIAASSKGIKFYVWVPSHLREFVEGQVYAQYPDAHIRLSEDYVSSLDEATSFCGETLTLARPSFFPVKTFREFEVDPLSAVTGAMSEVEEGEHVWIQLMVRPVADVWQAEGHAYVEQIRSGKRGENISVADLAKGVVGELASLVPHALKQLVSPSSTIPSSGPPPREIPVRISPWEDLQLKSIEDKLTRMGFEVGIRVFAGAKDQQSCRHLLRGVTAAFRQFSTANLNSFVRMANPDTSEEFKERVRKRTFPRTPFVLDTSELASIYHLPTIAVGTPAISWATYKKGEPPEGLPISNCNYIGMTSFRDKFYKFGIKKDDRRKHAYFVGKTGTGKSTLFLNMIVQDIRNGEGVGVLDPHGDLIDQVLDYIPQERLDDVIIFDPSNVNHPVGVNLLEIHDVEQKNLLGSGLLEVFKKHFGEISWGPRLEYLLNNCILTLLEVPHTTLLGVTRILSDRNYRNYIVYKIKDPVIKDFWENEYKQMVGNQRLVTEAVSPIQNKVGRFLASSTIRNIVGQATSSIDLAEAMDEGKILLINLSKGKIGEDNSNLLGSLLISRINFEAMQRVNIPENERKDFYLYADEFQNFASGSFASILSEARKYRLNLHITHQYTAQLPKSVADAVFGNVGTIVAFSLGAPDAKVLEAEFAPYFTAEDLISLEKHHMYIKLMIDGMTSRPFSGLSLPPPTGKTFLREEATEMSQQKYGRDREVIESRIRRWVEKPFDLGMAVAEEHGGEKAKG